MQELILPSQTPLLSIDHEGLVFAFFQGRKEGTKRSYERDLRAFAEFLGVQSITAAARLFFGCEEAQARAILISYRNQLLEDKYASATINRRLAALSSLVQLAQQVKLCNFQLEFKALPQEAMKDTRGPGREGVEALLLHLEGKEDKASLRNLVIIHLLYDLGLRRTEACGIDLEHISFKQGWVEVLGKARRGRQRLTLAAQTKEAIEAWLKVRGEEPGPLLLALDGAAYGRRLTGNGVWFILRKLGKEVGIVVRPHGLRHAAITDALDATNGDVRAVQKFSRHKSLEMLLTYDDARRDMGGEISKLIANRAKRGG